VEAVTTGLLQAFYASGIYEAILSELARSASTVSSTVSGIKVCAGPWDSGSLQRIVRRVTTPDGISLHRGPVRTADTEETRGEGQPAFLALQFEVYIPHSYKTLAPAPAISHTQQWPPACSLVADPPELLPYLMPASYDENDRTVRLVSYTVAQKAGTLLYGASLLSVRSVDDASYQAFSPTSRVANVASTPTAPVRSTPESGQQDLCGAEATSVIDQCSPDTTVGSSASGNSSSTAFLPPLTTVDIPPPDISTQEALSAGASGTASRTEWMASMLQRAASAVRSIDTAQMLQSLQHASSITTGDTSLVSRFALPGLSAGLPLSPFMRAVGLRAVMNSPLSETRRGTFSPTSGPMWSLYSPLAPHKTPLHDSAHSTAVSVVSGVAVVTNVPCVDALRSTLRAYHAGRSANPSVTWPQWMHDPDRCNRALEALRGCQAQSQSARGVASDFSAQALYEILSPAALTAIFTAFLVRLCWCALVRITYLLICPCFAPSDATGGVSHSGGHRRVPHGGATAGRVVTPGHMSTRVVSCVQSGGSGGCGNRPVAVPRAVLSRHPALHTAGVATASASRCAGGGTGHWAAAGAAVTASGAACDETAGCRAKPSTASCLSHSRLRSRQVCR
jgi:hypothetical protein